MSATALKGVELSCLERVKYDTKGQAEKAMKQLRKVPQLRVEEGMQPLRCRWCLGWHLGVE